MTHCDIHWGGPAVAFRARIDISIPDLKMRLREGQLLAYSHTVVPDRLCPLLGPRPLSFQLSLSFLLLLVEVMDLVGLGGAGLSQHEQLFLIPQCSAPRTIDWVALSISLIFAHPSALLFLYLHCLTF